jgi:hypothetical protein
MVGCTAVEPEPGRRLHHRCRTVRVAATIGGETGEHADEQPHDLHHCGRGRDPGRPGLHQRLVQRRCSRAGSSATFRHHSVEPRKKGGRCRPKIVAGNTRCATLRVPQRVYAFSSRGDRGEPKPAPRSTSPCGEVLRDHGAVSIIMCWAEEGAACHARTQLRSVVRQGRDTAEAGRKGKARLSSLIEQSLGMRLHFPSQQLVDMRWIYRQALRDADHGTWCSECPCIQTQPPAGSVLAEVRAGGQERAAFLAIQPHRYPATPHEPPHSCPERRKKPRPDASVARGTAARPQG